MSNPQIADKIIKECKQKNIKVSQLLAICNINHSFISDMRHKNRAPSVDKISAIADYLGVSVDYLLGRTETPNRITETTTISKEDAELLELIKQLPLKKRMTFISAIASTYDE